MVPIMKPSTEIFECLDECVIITDLNFEIVYFNSTAKNKLNLDVFSGLSLYILDFMPHLKQDEEKKRYARELIGQIFEQGSCKQDIILRSSLGQKYVFKGLYTLLRDSLGQAEQILLIYLDVTEEVCSNASLLKTKSKRYSGDLIAGLSHDLTNLFTPILLSLSRAKAQADNSPQLKQSLDLIESCVLDASRLSKDILSISRADPEQKSVIDTGMMLGKFNKYFKSQIKNNIDLIIDAVDNLWHFCGNFYQINQALLNVCFYIRDQMPQGGRIELFVRNVQINKHLPAMPPLSDGPYVCISVKTENRVTAKEILNSVYRPFFSKMPENAIGLGLFLAEEMIHRHQGFLFVHNDAIQGCFDIYLPAYLDSLPIISQPLPPSRLLNGNGRQILILESDANLLQSMIAILSDYNYRPMGVNNALDAIAYCSEYQPNGLILEMDFSDMSSVFWVKFLRKMYKNLPVLAIFNPNDVFAVDEFQKMKKTRILAKPFNAEMLIQALALTLPSSVKEKTVPLKS